MTTLEEFVSIIESEFPDDRLTWQKSVPTFHPENAEEAAGLLKLANRYARKIYITGFGNNIDPLGEPFVNMVSIRTDRLNDLQVISAESFYVTAGSGYPLRELNLHLREEGLHFPHASLPYVGSLGGAVAVNLSGRLGEHDVPIKRFFIKAQIVTPGGEIITPGSVAFKSVSGYDIVKIFSPSWGLLGLLVSLTFRVMPISGAEDYAAMTMLPVDRAHFLSGLDESSTDTDVMYSRKIKAKFDPRGILPAV